MTSTSSRDWESLGGDTRGSVTGLAKGAANVVFATTQIGVYRSSDAGRTWALSGIDTGVAFGEAVAVLGEHVFAGAPSGLHRSADGGRTWEHALAGSRVAAVCAGAGVVLAGTDTDGVLRSEDAGCHWTGVNAGLLDLEVLALCLSPSFLSDRTVFAGTASGVYRSRNGGDSWRAVETALDEPAVQCIAMGPDRLVVAGTEADGLVCSDDGGTTWHQPADLVGRSVTAVAICSTGSIAAATDAGVFVSGDRGQSWARGVAGPENILALLYVESGVLLAGAERTGAWRTDDAGAMWTASSTGLHASLLSTLVVGADGTLWAAGPTEGIRVWHGAAWHAHNAGLADAAVLGLSLAPDGRAFAATPQGIYVSTGDTWRQSFAGPVRAVSGSKRIVTVAEHVFVSDDLGETWRMLPAPFETDRVVAASAAATVLAVACRETAETVVWRLVEGDEHWERAFVDATARETLPLAVSEDAVFIGVGSRVVRCNAGASVALEGAITAIAIASDGSVWVGTSRDVFISRDGGGTFLPTRGPARVVALAPPYALEPGGHVWRHRTGGRRRGS